MRPRTGAGALKENIHDYEMLHFPATGRNPSNFRVESNDHCGVTIAWNCMLNVYAADFIAGPDFIKGRVGAVRFKSRHGYSVGTGMWLASMYSPCEDHLVAIDKNF